MKKAKVELLAPAGSFETMKAVISAGADAVYMGGPMFGARAYADNPDMETFLEAIDYAHIRGVKLYMTVNTLLKEDEMAEKLYNYILPFYNRGLDAVIVQDLGVLKFLKSCFPELTIHISTQMTCTGRYSAEYFKSFGAERIVPARELNLKEIKEICDTGIEVECFVHGAICYCYSGKCLFSSLAGGRSGNRGRCAQPCRQIYNFYDEFGNRLNNRNEKYLLSLKDMNTLDILPEIIEAGVYSLKIEGRMKKAEYAAGVVAIYRKYLDKILNGESYKVEPEDAERLMDLFNRNGFNKGYFKQNNGKDMMSLTETEFRSHDDEWQEIIRTNYIEREKKADIQVSAYINQGDDIVVTAECDGVYVAKTFDKPQKALKSATTYDQVEKQLKKTGNTDFNITDIDINIDDNSFIPVSELNNIRRETLSELKDSFLDKFNRTNSNEILLKHLDDSYETTLTSAKVESIDQLKACINYDKINRIYIAANIFDESITILPKDRRYEVYLSVAEPFRLQDEVYYDRRLDILCNTIDGVLCDSIESLCYFKTKTDLKLVADQGLYTWNSMAVENIENIGVQNNTAPYELNLKEFLRRGMKKTELVVYGYLPMMNTAGCLWKNTTGCKKTNGKRCLTGLLTDGQNRSFPVKSDCLRCGNIIYNCVPLVLGDDVCERLKPMIKRYQFTFENYDETVNILNGRINSEKITRGHIKRGVE